MVDKVDTLQEYTTAKQELDNILNRPGRFSSEAEREALQTFYTAASRPTEVGNIEKAKEAANNLPVGSEIKEKLINTIDKLENHYVPKEEIKTKSKFKEIENLKKLYQDVENEQQQMKDKYNKKMNEALFELSEIRKEKVEIQNQSLKQQPIINNNQSTFIYPTNTGISELLRLEQENKNKIDTKEQLMNQDNTVSSKVTDMTTPTINQENIKIENDIPEVVDNDIPAVKEPFSIPKLIKNVKQAGNKMLEKINKKDFKQKKNQVLDWMKNHNKAVLVGAAALAIAATTMLGAQLNIKSNTNQNKDDLNSNNPSTETEQEENINKTAIEKTIDQAMINTKQETLAVSEQAQPQKNEEELFNAEATTFYGENQNIITRDEAEAVINNGGEVVARFDNNGVPIGYVPVDQVTINQESGMSK